jgi:hypothetical protein
MDKPRIAAIFARGTCRCAGCRPPPLASIKSAHEPSRAFPFCFLRTAPPLLRYDHRSAHHCRATVGCLCADSLLQSFSGLISALSRTVRARDSSLTPSPDLVTSSPAPHQWATPANTHCHRASTSVSPSLSHFPYRVPHLPYPLKSPFPRHPTPSAHRKMAGDAAPRHGATLPCFGSWAERACGPGNPSLASLRATMGWAQFNIVTFQFLFELIQF